MELLIAMVLIPLVIGAITEAIVVTLRNSPAVSGHIADSVNAQLTSAYYVRDVQGASYITTDQTIPAPYTAATPQVCGSSVSHGTLMLGLYHPAQYSASGMSVGYWKETSPASSRLVRYVCTYPTSSFLASVTSSQTVSDDASAVQVSIAPSQFIPAAAQGWAPTTAATFLTGQAQLSSAPLASLSVASTAEFTPGNVTLNTSAGATVVNCTGTLANCTINSLLGTLVAGVGASITQDSITALQLLVTETGAAHSALSPSATTAGSPYTYELSAAPRVGAPAVGGVLPSGCAPGDGCDSTVPPATLIALGPGGISLNDTASTLQVTGDVLADQGSVTCKAKAGITWQNGGTAQLGNSAATDTCGQAALVAPEPDPLAPYLPSPFPTQPMRTASGCGTLQPGEYTHPITCGVLEPGVYVLDAGISLGGNTSLTVDQSGSNQGLGALLYLPPAGPNSTGTETISMNGNTSLTVPPLTAAQAVSENVPSALAGVFLWQDKGDTTSFALAGHQSVYSSGIAYLPSAEVDVTGTPGSTFGFVIASSISISGNSTISATG